MYKTILLPTDGSALSRQAVTSGVLFARNIGARVVGVYALPVPHEDLFDAWMHHDPEYADRREALFDKFAAEYLSFISNSALAEGVPSECKAVSAEEPYRAIIETAEQSHCDLIYMASHGWRGDASLMPGSQTLKVLTHCKLPVLVHRPHKATALYPQE